MSASKCLSHSQRHCQACSTVMTILALAGLALCSNSSAQNTATSDGAGMTIDIIKPVAGAHQSPAPDGSEFCFTWLTPGVLAFHVEVAVSPNTQETRDSIGFGAFYVRVVEGIGNISAEWTTIYTPGPPDDAGKLTYDTTSQKYTEWVRYEGLPANNSDFGVKTVKVTFKESYLDEEAAKEEEVPIEVFFYRETQNHPGGENVPALSGRRSL